MRDELARLGHEFHSRTDTEVVLHAFMEWGLEGMHRFVGMFAFAIHDAETGTVTLVRDRFGIKPLYYAKTERFILFGSEIKALLTALREPRVDKWSLAEWFLYRNVDGLTPETLIEGVRAVLPGQAVTIAARRGDRAAMVCAAPPGRPGRLCAASRPPAPRRSWTRSIASSRTPPGSGWSATCPVGTLLSGGLDSSLITAMAARHSRDLTAFHVSVAGHPDLDERRFAEQLTDKLEIPFVPFELNGENFRRALPRVVDLSDLPLTHPNSIAYYLISKVARDHGVIVLLSGEGADELFGGYSWAYRRTLWLHRLQPILRRLPKRLYDLAQLFVYAEAGMPVTSPLFRDLLPPTIDLLDRYARYDWREQCAAAYGFVEAPAKRGVLGTMLADLGDFLTPLLRRLDRTSMGASVECRVPFLDHRLVHECINLPMRYRIGARADKWVLKRVAERYLPAGLVERKKMGFPLPLADYVRPLASASFFAGGFCEEELGLKRRGLERLLDGWERWVYAFFGLVTLEIWGRLHFRNQSVELIEEQIRRLERRQMSKAA